jgi:hypothetical protein
MANPKTLKNRGEWAAIAAEARGLLRNILAHVVNPGESRP